MIEWLGCGCKNKNVSFDPFYIARRAPDDLCGPFFGLAGP
jgi:hypothetical protein